MHSCLFCFNGKNAAFGALFKTAEWAECCDFHFSSLQSIVHSHEKTDALIWRKHIGGIESERIGVLWS